MKRRIAISLLGAVACTSPAPMPQPPATHPASPLAAEAPEPERSRVLDLEQVEKGGHGHKAGER